MIGDELLFTRGIQLSVIWRTTQSLARETNSVFRAEVPVIRIDVNAIRADPLEIAAIILLELQGMENEITAFAVWIPADFM